MKKRLLNPVPGDTSPLAPLEANMTNCWRCSHCKWVPSPKSHDFSVACPSVEWGGFHSYSGGGKVITAHALKDDGAEFSDKAVETVFACTACGACDIACKTNNGDNVEPLDVMYALRATVAEEGKSPEAHKQMIDNLRRHGNSIGKPAAERMLWAKGLNLQNSQKEKTDVLLHIGCDYAYDDSTWGELRLIVNLLNQAKVNFGILFDQESTTGEEAFDLGFQDDALKSAEKMSKIFNENAATCVVTCSANSYSGVRNTWPRLGAPALRKEFMHITDFIYGLVQSGKLEIKANLNAKVTYHDSSKLGRLSEASEAAAPSNWIKVHNTIAVREIPKKTLFGNDGLYESPRNLLGLIEGLELVEMERNRLAAYSSGASGGAKEAYPEFANFAGSKRMKEARATGASILVSACPKSRAHLSEVSGVEGMKVMGLFELIETALDNNTAN